MSNILVIFDIDRERRFQITKETSAFIETNSVTFFEEYPIRFNKHEKCMEYFNGVEWDIFIPDSDIRSVNVIKE